jgi:hypothetical protein
MRRPAQSGRSSKGGCGFFWRTVLRSSVGRMALGLNDLAKLLETQGEATAPVGKRDQGHLVSASVGENVQSTNWPSQGRSEWDLGRVKTRGSGKLIGQISARIAISAMTISERGRICAI